VSRQQRYVLDITSEEHEEIRDRKTGRRYLAHNPRHHLNGHEVRIYAMWHHEPNHVPSDVRDIEPDKWMVKVTDLDDPRRNFEFWFDNLFPARMQRKRNIDWMRGLIYRKVLVEIAKRVVKRSDMPHTRGAQLPAGKSALRPVARATAPAEMIQVAKRTRIFAGGNYRKREIPLPIIPILERNRK
jgi:hypothetical protein